MPSSYEIKDYDRALGEWLDQAVKSGLVTKNRMGIVRAFAMAKYIKGESLSTPQLELLYEFTHYF